MWHLLTGTIPPGRTVMHVVICAVELSTIAVGHHTKVIDPGVNSTPCMPRNIDVLQSVDFA